MASVLSLNNSDVLTKDNINSLIKTLSAEIKEYKLMSFFAKNMKEIIKLINTTPKNPTIIVIVHFNMIFGVHAFNKAKNINGTSMCDIKVKMNIPMLKRKILNISQTRKIETECPVCYCSIKNKQTYMCHRCNNSICLECSKKVDICPFCRQPQNEDVLDEKHYDIKPSIESLKRQLADFIMSRLC